MTLRSPLAIPIVLLSSWSIASEPTIDRTDEPGASEELKEVNWPDPHPRKREDLLISEKILNAHEDVATVPLSFNFDRNTGMQHRGSTQYVTLQPYVPFRLDENYSVVVYPTATYQYFQNFDGINSQGFKPFVLQSFLTQSGQSTLRTSFGAGPMVVIPSGAGLEFGSKQTGVGYSLAGIHRTERWVTGFLGYQSFAVSAPTQGLSANNVQLRPFLTFITSKAGNITLDTETSVNMDNGMRSVPINLMASKIINFGPQPLLVTLGARYYAVNTMFGGAQGWGGRIGLMYAFPR